MRNISCDQNTSREGNLTPQLPVWLIRWRHRARHDFAGPQASRWQAAPMWSRLLLLLAAAGLIVFAAARPQWGSREVSREREAVDVVIALDISASMLATDDGETRFDIARVMHTE